MKYLFAIIATFVIAISSVALAASGSIWMPTFNGSYGGSGSGVFGFPPNLTWNSTTNILNVTGQIYLNGTSINASGGGGGGLAGTNNISGIVMIDEWLSNKTIVLNVTGKPNMNTSFYDNDHYSFGVSLFNDTDLLNISIGRQGWTDIVSSINMSVYKYLYGNVSGTGLGYARVATWINSTTLQYGLTFDNGSAVGIGTLLPTQKLDVNGSVNVSGTVYASNVSSNSPLQLQTQGTTRIYVDDTTGYVGIGTSSPNYPLHVEKNLATGDYVAKFKNTGVLSFGLLIETDSSDVREALQVQRSDGTPFLSVENSGNVGIGTQSPQVKLDVNGTTNTTNFTVGGTSAIFWDSTNSRMVIQVN